MSSNVTRCNAAVAPSSPAVAKTLNPRVANLQPSKTMMLSDLASSLREAGKDIISLAAGEPDFDTPEPIVKAGIQAMQTSLTHYTPNTGTSALRKAIVAKLAAENGINYDPSEIVISNGAKQSIWQAVLATVSPGEEVIIPAPYWTTYPSLAELAGANPVIVETTLEAEFLMTAQQLRKAITPASRILILCSPSNPTGAVYPLERLQELAEVVEEHPKLLVLSDEIYEHIMYPPSKHHSFASLPGMWERTLTVNGFSKAFAMTGWRLGYLAAPKPFAKAAAAIQSQSTSGASSISQHAGVAALQMGHAGGELVQEMVDAFLKRRDFVVKRLQGIKGVKVKIPEGAFYLMPEVSAFCGPQVQAKGFGAIPDVDSLCRYLLEKALVAVVPGEAFGSPDCLRMSYAASLENLEKAMDRIEAALEPANFEM